VNVILEASLRPEGSRQYEGRSGANVRRARSFASSG
jgi:hypothetical protein